MDGAKATWRGSEPRERRLGGTAESLQAGRAATRCPTAGAGTAAARSWHTEKDSSMTTCEEIIGCLPG